MSVSRPKDFEAPGPARERALADLASSTNAQLLSLFEREKVKGNEHLAATLVNWVESYVLEHLNQSGFFFGRLDYSGDLNYENSEQTFGDGDTAGAGIVLKFRGFKCTAQWGGG